jgi:aryl sulfotransferase
VTRVRYQSFLTDSARWDGFAFRPGDIIISTPAKCGTTWTQMICALLIFETPDLPRSLDLLSPWMEMRLRRRRDVWDLYEAQTHRRFIKSHTPLDGLPVDERITYICVGRDPRDVALSWDAHMNNIDFDAMFNALGAAIEPDDSFGPPRIRPTFTDPRDAVRYWVDDPTPPEEMAMSLAGLLHHLAQFWAACGGSRRPCRGDTPHPPGRDRDDVILLHYDDLQTDLEGEMRRLADRLEIPVPEDRWPTLVKAATFDDMRRRADERAPDTANRIWKSTTDFFHRGTSGQWEGVFDGELAAHYETRVRELAPPDLVAWLHRGTL